MSDKTNASLKEQLFEKMKAEQDKYRNWLLSLEPTEILTHTHEYTTREDILIAMGMRQQNLTDQQCSALLSLPDPLNTLYNEILDLDIGIEEQVFEVAAKEANRIIIKKWHEEDPSECDGKWPNVPMYYEGFSWAIEHNELGMYLPSDAANIACIHAIDEMIDKSFNGSSMNTERLDDIISKFGMERVVQLLATIIKASSWDGRYSQSNKAWADATALLKSPVYVENIHPGLINLLVDTLRKEYNI